MEEGDEGGIKGERKKKELGEKDESGHGARRRTHSAFFPPGAKRKAAVGQMRKEEKREEEVKRTKVVRDRISWGCLFCWPCSGEGKERSQ